MNSSTEYIENPVRTVSDDITFTQITNEDITDYLRIEVSRSKWFSRSK